MMSVNLAASTFDPEVFTVNMHAIFGPSAVGYGFALNYDGQIAVAADGGGDARTIAEDKTPGLPFDETTEMEIASVSKPVTAVAVIHRIQEAIEGGIFTSDDATIQAVLDDDTATIAEKVSAALNTKLEDYVPEGWVAGDLVDRVTLRHLLTHNSGFNENDPNATDASSNSNGTSHNFNSFGDNTWNNIRDLYEQNLPEPTDTYSDTGDERWGYSYNNANFTFLAKVVFPTLWGVGVDVDDGTSLTTTAYSEIELDPSKVDDFTGSMYEFLVRTYIFGSMELTDVLLTTDDTPDDDVLAYNSTDPIATTNGGTMSDLLETGGAFGWKMSAEELATFMYKVRNDSYSLDPAVRDMMFERGLGWSTGNDEFGNSYGHGGRQRNGNSQTFRSQVGAFDVGANNSIEVAVLMNSEDSVLPYGGISDSTKEAFHQAWTHLVYDGSEFGDDVFTITIGSSGAEPVLELYEGTDTTATPVLSQWLSTLQSLRINGLGGNDKFYIDDLPDSVSLIIDGGDDDDFIDVGGGADLATIEGNLTVIGGGGFNRMQVQDLNGIGTEYLITGNTIQPPSYSKTFNYNEIDDLRLLSNAGENVITVTALAATTKLTVDGHFGNDHLHVGGKTLGSGNLTNIKGDIVYIGSNGEDTLVIDDQNSGKGRDYYFGQNPTTSFFDAAGVGNISFEDDVELVQLQASDQKDHVKVEASHENTTLEVFGNASTDHFYVAESSRDLSPVAGPVIFHGGSGQTHIDNYREDDDQLYVYDDHTVEFGDYTVDRHNFNDLVGSILKHDPLNDPNVTKPVPKSVSFDLTYDQIEQTELTADDGDSRIDVIAAPRSNELTLFARNGKDEIYVESTPLFAQMFIHGQGGEDMIRIASTAHNLAVLKSQLNVFGGVGVGEQDQLIVNDSVANSLAPYTLTSTEFSRHDSQLVDYNGFERLDVHLNQVDNLITVESTDADTTVYGNQGNDTMSILSASSPISFSGGTHTDWVEWIGTDEDDAFTVGGNTFHLGNASVTTLADVEGRRVEGGLGQDLLRIEGVAGVDEYFHIHPNLLDPFIGKVEFGNWLPVDYSLEDMALEGNSTDIDRGAMDARSSEGDVIDIDFTAQGTSEDPLIRMRDESGDFLRLRNYSGLSSAGPFLPAFQVKGLDGLIDLFNVTVTQGTPTGNPTSISLDGGAGPDFLNVTYTTGAEVDHQQQGIFPGNISVDYGNLAYEISYQNFEEGMMHEVDPPSPPIPGDYDGNGVVDEDDYGVWKELFGEMVEPYTNADGNGDGQVSILDYLIWRNNLGATAPPEDPDPLAAPLLASAFGDRTTPAPGANPSASFDLALSISESYSPEDSQAEKSAAPATEEAEFSTSDDLLLQRFKANSTSTQPTSTMELSGDLQASKQVAALDEVFAGLGEEEM